MLCSADCSPDLSTGRSGETGGLSKRQDCHWWPWRQLCHRLCCHGCKTYITDRERKGEERRGEEREGGREGGGGREGTELMYHNIFGELFSVFLATYMPITYMCVYLMPNSKSGKSPILYIILTNFFCEWSGVFFTVR